MKITVVLIATLFISATCLAQKNNTFADIGSTGSITNPGFSVTFNKKLVKYFGVGLGVQGYNYVSSDSNFKNTHQFIPAVYADLRGYLPVKKSLFFALVDLGMNIYKHTDALNPSQNHNNGFYTGLGFGYSYTVTKRGCGPYISIKMISDSYKSKQYNPSNQQDYQQTNVDGNMAISLGYKF